jgi:hypothetical protein
MNRQKTVLISLIIISIFLFITDQYYKNIQLEKVFLAALSLAVFYFLFEFLIRGKVINRIKEPEGRYYLSRTISFAELLIFVLIIGMIWLENIQGLVLS